MAVCRADSCTGLEGVSILRIYIYMHNYIDVCVCGCGGIVCVCIYGMYMNVGVCFCAGFMPAVHGLPQTGWLLAISVKLNQNHYSRLQEVGTWICWISFLLWFGVGGRPCSNLLGSVGSYRD